MDILIQLAVIIKEVIMREIDNNEMLCVEGGTNFSAAMLGAIYKTIDIIFSLGESLGSYIRRVVENKMCDI